MADFRALAAQLAQQYGIPFFPAQIGAESGFRPDAVSPAGAQGIAQVMPQYHPDAPAASDPVGQLKWAAQYMAGLMKQYGNPQDALSVYNSGQPWAKGQNISETSGYVNKILGQGSSPHGSAPTAAAPTSLPGASFTAAPMSAAPQGDPLEGLLSKMAMGKPFNPLQNYLESAFGLQNPSQFTSGSPLPAIDTSFQDTSAPVTKGLFSGKPLDKVDGGFLGKLSAAAKAAGVTKIEVSSAFRTPETNTGVSNSNHLTGHALDGRAYIPGTGWIPLGNIPGLDQFGLRSGNQPGFYKGAPDPEHVDDAFNQR